MKLAGVGIDLVDLSRIRRFFKAHSQSRLKRLLSEKERRQFSRKKIPAVAFAKLFTAKEAFFKTLNRPWMGVEGFASMDTQFLTADHFRIRVVDGPLAKEGPCEAEGCFFHFGKFLGAQVIR